jgi:putative transposase
MASFLLSGKNMRVPRCLYVGPFTSVHKIWRCHDREFLLKDPKDKLAYLQAIHDDYLKRCSNSDFSLQAYNVMSNHVHEKTFIKASLAAFSRHMQRAHGIFGLRFNQRHKRLGKVAHDRPRTLCIENAEAEMRCTFYIDCNPVRAGLIKHPTDVRWKNFSSCGYYALGRKNRFDEMLELPDWYLALGKTARQRQRKYRSLLDRYLIEHGLKRDPKMSSGHFLGGELWKIDRTSLLGGLLKILRAATTGPPDQ